MKLLALTIVLLSAVAEVLAQTPHAAASFTADTIAAVEINRPFVRTIWNTGGDEQYKALTIAINTALNHSARSYVPPEVVAKNGTRLLLLDFTKFSDDVKEINRLLEVWDRLSIQDPFFHELFIDGNRTRVRFAGYLAEVSGRFDVLFGDPRPTLRMPVAYGPWALVKMLASVDGGQYLAFRGLTPGKTKLNDYLASRECPIPTKGVERIGLISRVTGKARGIAYYQGSSTRPTAGRSLVFITDDIFDENNDPNSDPFHALARIRPDGHEVFVVLPNGWIEFTLFNGDGVLVAEAPMGSPKFLVSDNRVPAPFSPRLHGAISCLRCHASDDGYKPAQNEVADRLRTFGILANSLSKSASGLFADLKKIGDLYQAKQFEIDAVLQDARDGFDRRVFEVTGINDPHAAKLGCDHVTTVYNGHEYEWVSAALALTRAGVELPQGDPDGTKLMARLALPPSPELYPPEALDTMLHLATLSEVTTAGKVAKVPLKVHVRQWEGASNTINRRLQEIQE